MDGIPPNQHPSQHNHLEPPKVKSLRIDCSTQGTERITVRDGAILTHRRVQPVIGRFHVALVQNLIEPNDQRQTFLNAIQFARNLDDAVKRDPN